MWLDQDMQWLSSRTGRRRRQKTFSDAAIQFCLSTKGLFRLALLNRSSQIDRTQTVSVAAVVRESS